MTGGRTGFSRKSVRVPTTDTHQDTTPLTIHDVSCLQINGVTVSGKRCARTNSTDTFESFFVLGFTYSLVGVPGVGRGGSKLVACSLIVTRRRGTTDDGCTYSVRPIKISKCDSAIILPVRFAQEKIGLDREPGKLPCNLYCFSIRYGVATTSYSVICLLKQWQ